MSLWTRPRGLDVSGVDVEYKNFKDYQKLFREVLPQQAIIVVWNDQEDVTFLSRSKVL